MKDVQAYIPLAKFLSEFLGSKAEVVLSDTVNNEIVFVANPSTEQSKVGKGIRHLEEKFIKKKIHKSSQYVSNYRAFSENKDKLRSSTYFIKDEVEEVIGLLTINMIVDRFIEARDLLDKFINGEENYQSPSIEKTIIESFEPSFEEMMSQTINDVIRQYDSPPERMTLDEKMQIIEQLDNKGTFLIKGSITELANIFETTETTIYRYINKLSDKK